MLGPTLFQIYINDLPQSLSWSNECVIFADDRDTTAYLGKLPFRRIWTLQQTGRKGEESCSTWKRVHMSACICIIVSDSIESNAYTKSYHIPKVTEHLGRALEYRALCHGLTKRVPHVLGELGFCNVWRKSYSVQQMYTGTVRPIMEYACAKLEWRPDSKADKTAAFNLPESRCKSTSIAYKVRLLYSFFFLNQNSRVVYHRKTYTESMWPNPSSQSGYQHYGKLKKKSR